VARLVVPAIDVTTWAQGHWMQRLPDLPRGAGWPATAPRPQTGGELLLQQRGLEPVSSVARARSWL